MAKIYFNRSNIKTSNIVMCVFRDLAKNWDVDIASSLEDYLEDLEDITITLDGGGTKVNFAEAALLIQGSTSVYSRKVEHVYQLVLRTIDFLTQQKDKQDAKARSGNSGDDNDISTGGEDMMFFLWTTFWKRGSISTSKCLRGGVATPVDQALVNLIPTLTAMFPVTVAMVMGGEERGGLPAGGGDVPDISRPPMFLMEQDYGNSFKMSTCAVDQSGALLIEGSTLGSSGGASFYFDAAGGANPLSRDGAADGAARGCDFWGGLRKEGVGLAEGGLGEEGGQFDGLGGGGDDDDDSDGGGGDFGGDYGQEDGFDGPDDGEGKQSLTICRLCLAAGDDDGDDSKEGGRGGFGRAMGRNDGFDYPEEGKGEERTGEG
eukprot:jgi/Undpi1/3063/HiC_scaffold_15.g06439.m1